MNGHSTTQSSTTYESNNPNKPKVHFFPSDNGLKVLSSSVATMKKDDGDRRTPQRQPPKAYLWRILNIFRWLSATKHTTRGNNRKDMKAMVLRWLKLYVALLDKGIHRDRLLKVLQYGLGWMAISINMLAQKQGGGGGGGAIASVLWMTGSMNKLSAEIGWARFVQRLLEWPMAMEAAWTGSWTPSSYKEEGDQQQLLSKRGRENSLYRFMLWFFQNGSKDNNENISSCDSEQAAWQWIGRILSWSMVAYYPTEHISYLQWKAMAWTPSTSDASPLSSSLSSSLGLSRRGRLSRILQASADDWSMWSCRFWLAYMVAEILTCCVHRAQLRAILMHHHKKDNNKGHEQNTRSSPVLMDVLNDSDENGELLTTPSRGELMARRSAERALHVTNIVCARDLFFLLPCLQWSFPQVKRLQWSATTITSLMLGEAILSLYQSIHSLQPQEEQEEDAIEDDEQKTKKEAI